MSKYIIDVNDEAYDPNNPANYYLYRLDGPFILCRDCKYYHPELSGCEKPFGVFFDAHDGDFCSYAEPKEGEE